MATRADAIANARQHLHSGEFIGELNRRVGYRTESQNSTSGAALRAYLVEDLQPAFAALDFTTRLIESPTGRGPYLLADYHEDASLPTLLTWMGQVEAKLPYARIESASLSAYGSRSVQLSLTFHYPIEDDPTRMQATVKAY